MQRLGREWQRAGKTVVLMPTMGFLHRGHASLMERARQLAGDKGRVVASVYVNPAQFGPEEDFARYPRDVKGDQRLCRAAGVDVFFAPGDAEMYPADFSTAVQEEKLAGGMEGAARPGHFRGVTTVVAKLFNIVLPTAAVFGAKDFQQAAVIRRMTRDLNFPVKIVVAPTVREADGLAHEFAQPISFARATGAGRGAVAGDPARAGGGGPAAGGGGAIAAGQRPGWSRRSPRRAWIMWNFSTRKRWNRSRRPSPERRWRWPFSWAGHV